MTDRPRIRAVAALFATTAALALLPPGAARAAFPGHNGRIAFESGRTDELDIYTANPDGSGLKRLTGGIKWDRRPRFSADGTRIVYFRTTFEEGHGDIWVMDADGSNKVNLTPGPGDDREPVWSPNGQRIAFTRGGDLWVMDADGTHRQRLTFSPAVADFGPSWSSTNVIAFTSFRTGNGDVYTIRPDRSHLHRVTTGPQPDMYPDWSPSGTRIVFFTDPGPSTTDREIWRIRPDGTGLKRLTNNHVDDSYPSWSPNGKRITLQRDVRENGLDFYDVWTMRTDGTDLRRVTHDGFIDGVPNWQPA